MTVDYKIFILSYNSPDICLTFDNLINTYKIDRNKINIVIGLDDKSIDKYNSSKYSDRLLIFDKYKYIDSTDAVMFPKKFGSSVYAKNFIEDYCEENNILYFIVIDDDLKKLDYRYISGNSLAGINVTNQLEDIIQSYFEYIIEANLDIISFGMETLYFGGIKTYRISKRRLFSNLYFRNGKRKIIHRSAMYEDVNTSHYYASIGYKIFMLPFIKMIFKPQRVQMESKNINYIDNSGSGFSELYNSFDSYQRVFFCTIMFPCAVHPFKYKGVYIPKTENNYIFPKLLNEIYKKK